MNRKSSNVLVVFFGLVLSIGVAFLNFSIGSAQTANTTPSPTPPTVGTPPPLTIDKSDEEIRIETELVNLSVQVIDRFNRPISTLRKEDFKIFEDRVPQTITYFSQEEVPTNYALVIDNSGSLRFQLEKVIEASKTIVSTNRPEDETGVIRFVSTEKIEILQDFTSSREDLNDALDNMFIEGGPTSIIDAVYLSAQKVDDYKKTRSSADRKRRALILVSDGEDRSSYYKEEQLFKMLDEADVQIYAIGFIDDLDNDGNFIRKSPQKKAKNFLSRLATQTGGKSYFPKSVAELPTIAKDIARELRTQYLLSYEPTNLEKDGALRNIKVDVKQGPNDQRRIARYKTGRVSAKESKLPSLQKN